MAGQKSQSSLFAKLGDKLLKAHEEHKNDDMKMDQFGELPPDINGGVAQLFECKFDTYKSGKNFGKLYFYASGVVKAPQTGPKGEVIEGLRTKIGPEPFCDTLDALGKRKSLADHVEWVYDELRKLGIDTKNLDPKNLETITAALKKAKPYFRFRTWQSKPTAEFPNPRVNHTWNGLCEWENDEDVYFSHVDIATQEAEPDGPGDFDSPASKEEEEIVITLAKLADAGDEEAGERLNEIALSVGLKDDTIASSPDWKAVAQMVKTARTVPSGIDFAAHIVKPVRAVPPSSEVKDVQEPVVGESYGYRPIDFKTKKPRKKSIDCDVVSIDKHLKTVTLKNLDDEKIEYKGVKWDELEVI